MKSSNSELISISKYLSYVLRHCPESIDLILDKNGWASIDELIKKSIPQHNITRETLREVVVKNEKKRFKISDDGKRVRANQGHSLKVDLDLVPSEPPEILFHGTAQRFLGMIKLVGLKPGKRNHVHLTPDKNAAINVGKRYGAPVLLEVRSGDMFREGFIFYLSENYLWLTEHVPEQFILTR